MKIITPLLACYQHLLKSSYLCSIFQEELIDPAVKGTVNVLTSCTKFPSIKRVVVTSSMAAVMFNKTPVNTDAIIDETWFSDPVYCEESKVCSSVTSFPFLQCLLFSNFPFYLSGQQYNMRFFIFQVPCMVA